MNSTVMNSTCKDLLFQLSGQPVVTLVDSGDQARQNARLRTWPKATSAHTPPHTPRLNLRFQLLRFRHLISRPWHGKVPTILLEMACLV